ncbi:MAG: MBL fold metallo-hydrolase RNA specificity domain-containing protein [Synergistaceae bacterium]
MLKPRFFVPVHGEYRHLARHAQLARDMGVASKNIFVMQNGDVLRFRNKTSASVDGRVQSGAVLVDGIALGEFEGQHPEGKKGTF